MNSKEFFKSTFSTLQAGCHSFFEVYKTFNTGNLAASGFFFLIFTLASSAVAILWTGLLFTFVAPGESFFENLSYFDGRIMDPLSISLFGVQLIAVMIFANFLKHHDVQKSFTVANVFSSISAKAKVNYIWLGVFYFLLSTVYIKTYSYEGFGEFADYSTFSRYGGTRYGYILDRIIELIMNPLIVLAALIVFKRKEQAKISLKISKQEFSELIGRIILILSLGLIINKIISVISNDVLGILISAFDNWILSLLLSQLILYTIYTCFLPGFAALFGKSDSGDIADHSSNDDQILDDIL